MKIYTKGGDKGRTSLANGERVGKDSLRIDTYGTADELNSFVGLLRSKLPQEEQERMDRIQNKLFDLGALLSCAKGEWITETDVDCLEQWIDEMQAGQQPLKAFVLPGGSETIALSHVCRTITRRLERLMTALASSGGEVDEAAMKWVNRLSDFWFVYALERAKIEKTEQFLWKK